MRIITLSDAEFPALQEELRGASCIGSYLRKSGQTLMVYAAERHMLVVPAGDQTRIALRPARDRREAEDLARAYLQREQARSRRGPGA